MRVKRAAALVLLALALPTGAAPPAQRIDAERLHAEPQWTALLHLRRTALTRTLRSEADAPGFFLAAGGGRDPRAELLATVAALTDPGRAHATACRFPARAEWLRQRAGLALPLRLPQDCPELAAWFAPLAAGRMSIVFASAYLENPSSIFGHTFLRFDRDGVPVLLAPTANYAADAAGAADRPGFVVRGLFGGYPGVADIQPFHRRVRTYVDNEARDLWDYPLRLSPAEVRRLLLHLWEVRGSTFDYFYLDENCSYRTLALIGAARPDLALPEAFVGDVVPVETLKVLERAGLLGAPTFWPSATRSLLWRTRGFTPEQLRRTVALGGGATPPAGHDPAPVIAAALEYAGALIVRERLAPPQRDAVVDALVKARLARPALPPDPLPVPDPPTRAHGGHVASAGLARRGGEVAVEAAYSGFQHRVTDPVAGFAPGAEVTILGGRLRFGGGRAFAVERLDLVGVAARPPGSLLLRPPAWALRAGAKRKRVGDRRVLLAGLGHSRGRAWSTPVGVFSVLAGADLDAGPGLDDGAGVEAILDLELGRQTARHGWQGWLRGGAYMLGEDSRSLAGGMRLGTPVGNALGLVLELEYDGEGGAATVELRRYW